MTYDEAFAKLNKSTFRTSFKLKQKDIDYIDQKGFDVIASHAKDFVAARLAPKVIENDGKQTPTKGHPVFVAQHATACCCRGCLNKWYRVPKDVELSDAQQAKIVNLLMEWIKREYQNYKSAH